MDVTRIMIIFGSLGLYPDFVQSQQCLNLIAIVLAFEFLSTVPGSS